jgi:2-C-methyl-D-erythritol 4-phosphate cytidylyltransferase/2-C-methyl-D-erythritol 2,4-cyclodiphosphate synthase
MADEYIAIIAAAGNGSRMKSGIPKQFMDINGRSLLWRVCSLIQKIDAIKAGIVMCAPAWERHTIEIVSEFPKIIRVVIGGSTRSESIAKGLMVVKEFGYKWVVVHDAARPFATPELFEQVMKEAKIYGAALAAWPSSDTVKQGDALAEVSLPREKIWLAQTPQAFAVDLLQNTDIYIQTTDEAELLERAGYKPKLVAAPRSNFKITNSEDLALARRIFNTPPKIGVGFDVHPLKSGRYLILAGVTLDYHLGLDGHSDADVLTHALMDALLSAAGMGDCGRHFPDNNQIYKDINSLKLLAQVRQMLGSYNIQQINAVLIAQAPKIAPYVPQMRHNWANVLNIDAAAINIAATTTEGLGFVGRHEGMAAQVQALIL